MRNKTSALEKTSSSNTTDLGRRAVLKSAAIFAGAGAAIAVGAGAAMQSCAPTGNAPGKAETSGTGDPSVIARDGAAVVEIEPGKIAGAVINGIYSFKGVPYGATTAGQNRFCPAQKPEPWNGIRSSRQYGLGGPAGQRHGPPERRRSFHLPVERQRVEGEDCLRLNVWTPGINDSASARSWSGFMGGFSAGSGHDLPA